MILKRLQLKTPWVDSTNCYIIQDEETKETLKEETIDIIKTEIGKKWNPHLAEEFISILETEEF